MGFMFYVPACLVGHIRRGLFAELVLAGEEIQGLARGPAGEDSMEELRLLVACVDGVWALFGVLGCCAAVDPVGVEVDLRVHRWTLQLALHHEIERYEGLVARAREEGACARRRGLARRREMLRELRRAVEVHASGLDDPAEGCGLEWGPGGRLSVGEWAILHLLLEDSAEGAEEHGEALALTPSCVA
jgi:hypothetical protein